MSSCLYEPPVEGARADVRSSVATWAAQRTELCVSPSCRPDVRGAAVGGAGPSRGLSPRRADAFPSPCPHAVPLCVL